MMKRSERLRKTVELKAASASIWDNWEVSGWKELVDEVAQLEAENEARDKEIAALLRVIDELDVARNTQEVE